MKQITLLLTEKTRFFKPEFKDVQAWLRQVFELVEKETVDAFAIVLDEPTPMFPINEVNKFYPERYFFKYDVKGRSLTELCSGEKCKVLEFRKKG